MTQPTPAAPASQALLDAATGLRETHARFAARELSSVEHARAREGWIAQGLAALAEQHGVRLKDHLHIDSRGEYLLAARRQDQPAGSLDVSAGPFKTFAEVLNRYQPRCGLLPVAVLTPDSGWCYLNHFQAEAMVLEAAFGPQHAASATAAPAAEAKRRNRP